MGELSVDRFCQEHGVMREFDANDTSGELGSALTELSWGCPS